MTEYVHRREFADIEDSIELPDDAIGVTVRPRSGMLPSDLIVDYLIPAGSDSQRNERANSEER